MRTMPRLRLILLLAICCSAGTVSCSSPQETTRRTLDGVLTAAMEGHAAALAYERLKLEEIAFAARKEGVTREEYEKRRDAFLDKIDPVHGAFKAVYQACATAVAGMSAADDYTKFFELVAEASALLKQAMAMWEAVKNN